MRKNCYHRLQANDNLNMQNDFIFFDTETEITKLDDIFFGSEWELRDYSQELKLGWAIYWNRLTGIKEYKYFENNKDFINFIEDKADELKPFGKKRNKRELYVYAHNTQFDFNIVNGYEEMIVNRGWKVHKIYIEQAIFILELVKGKTFIKIYDTFNYVNKSLKDIGVSIGLEKMEISFNDSSKEKLIDYCKNDTEIVCLFIQKLIEFLTENNLTQLKATSASLAFNAFKHSFYNSKNKPIFIHAHSKTIALERKSYRGGISDCFKVGRTTKKLIKLDINSMYPFMYRNKSVPTKKEIYLANNGTNYKDMCIGLMNDYLIIADCEFYLPKEYAYILLKFIYKKELKTGFVHGNLKAVLTSPEIDFILKHGKINKIKEFAAYQHAIMFKDYADFFYNKRLEYHELKNYAFELMSKEMLNKLYGKFAGYGSDIDIINDMPLVHEISSILVYQENKKPYRDVRIGTTQIKMSKSDTNSYDSFVAISSFITAYARMYLIELILKIGRENMYYCDTDSLIFHKEYLHKIKDFIDVGTVKEMGKLKIEGESTLSEFIRPKFYLFDNELKIKGVKKKHINKFEDADNLVIKQEQFQKFKTALRKQNLGSQRIQLMEKHLDKIYDKGIILPNNDIQPYPAEMVIMR